VRTPNPAAGRHSLQVEINKRLYMDEPSRQPHAGFATLQRDLMALLPQIAAWAQVSRANV
jgi:N-formylglutamate amidohydrolase